MQKTDRPEFKTEKVIKRKGDGTYAKWNGYDNSCNSWIDKKDLANMSQYFPKPYEPFGANITSFALKSNLASLKTEVDKLDIDKLVPIPVDLSKLSNVVKNDIIKKTEYNKLVKKVDNIDTTNFVKKIKYEKHGSDFEDKINKLDKKIPDVSGLVKKKKINTEVVKIEGKIPSITGLTTVQN